MGFPVTLGGDTYVLGDFYPMGYTTALFSSIESMGDEYKKGVNGTSTTSMTIAGTGGKTFTAQAGLNWVPFSTMLRISNSSSNYMSGRVSAYNEVTGVTTVQIYASAGSGTFASWTIAEVVGHPSFTGVPLGFDQGGTGSMGANAIDIRGNLHNPAPTQGMQTICEDFAGFMSPGIGVDRLGPWVVTSTVSSTVPLALNDATIRTLSGNTSFGIAGLYGTNAGDRTCMSYGSGGFMSVAQGGDFLFVTSVYIPTISTSTDRFVSRTGLRASVSDRYSDIFDICGIGFEYSDNLHSGHWGCVVRDASGSRITNPYPGGEPVAAATWYTLAIYGNRKEKRVYFKAKTFKSVLDFRFTDEDINASWRFSASIASWPTEPKYLAHPAISQHKMSGTGQRFVYTDYVWLSKILHGGR